MFTLDRLNWAHFLLFYLTEKTADLYLVLEDLNKNKLSKNYVKKSFENIRN